MDLKAIPIKVSPAGRRVGKPRTQRSACRLYPTVGDKGKNFVFARRPTQTIFSIS